LKRRLEGRSSHRQSLLPKMKMMKLQTRTGKVLATTATVAAMLKTILNMRKVPQRLTSLADIADRLVVCCDLYKYVKSYGYNV
jgi:hypothetical protein